VLVLQSLPFFSAVALAVLEKVTFNDFAYWKRTWATMIRLIGLPQAQQQVPVSLSSAVSKDRAA
jgi:hypothetical protein